MTNEELLAAHWLNQERRGLQKTSIKARDRSLRLLLAAYPKKKLTNITRPEIEVFLDGRGMDVSTRRTWLAHLNGFYKWAVTEGYTKSNPVAAIVRPKMHQRLPRPADTAELDKALAAGDKREKAWVMLAAFCGLRCMEIAGLRTEDVNLEQRVLRIVGKGDKERFVAMNARTAQALKALPLPTSGRVFTRPRGTGLSAHDVSVDFNRFLRRAGVNATAHQLRHWYATAMYTSTRDLLLVQSQLGHASPSTTAGYAAFDTSRAADAVKRLNFKPKTRSK